VVPGYAVMVVHGMGLVKAIIRRLFHLLLFFLILILLLILIFLLFLTIET
jgi:hypothetical protein